MTRCSSCGENFFCGIEARNGDCWCFHKPKKQPHEEHCFCEKCLTDKTR